MLSLENSIGFIGFRSPSIVKLIRTFNLRKEMLKCRKVCL